MPAYLPPVVLLQQARSQLAQTAPHKIRRTPFLEAARRHAALPVQTPHWAPAIALPPLPLPLNPTHADACRTLPWIRRPGHEALPEKPRDSNRLQKYEPCSMRLLTGVLGAFAAASASRFDRPAGVAD